jgi:polysaccharide deacetylase family protein (PEP-CTERM system associated)
MKQATTIITVDVEEWFHGHNYLAQFPPERWEAQESRVVGNTERCLELLARYEVQATFFVLGWIAERHPELVGKIAAAGHELGCHGYGHPVLYRLRDAEFVEDLDRALAALNAVGVVQVAGYRAPSFSLTRPVHHFYEMLRDHGFRYDSSLFPIHHPRYGQPAAPRLPFRLARSGPDPFVVVPMPTVRVCGVNLPFAGGGYLRLLPWFTYRGLCRWAQRQSVPVVVYLHPWELDDYRPETNLSWLGKMRSQGGQESMPRKLEAILAAGRFQTLGKYVSARLAAGDLPQRSLPLY